MKYFLAVFTLRTEYYMQDKPSRTKYTRLILADSEEEAKIKLHKAYRVTYYDYGDESKSFSFEYDYSSANSFDDLDISEPIE
jgi:hypothetical protein